ncbi:hypothetical protein D3C77_641940 [compost metagenome]
MGVVVAQTSFQVTINPLSQCRMHRVVSIVKKKWKNVSNERPIVNLIPNALNVKVALY